MNTQNIWAVYGEHALQVFLAAFLTTVGSTISTGIQWNWAFVFGLISAAAGVAIKAVLAQTTLPLVGKK